MNEEQPRLYTDLAPVPSADGPRGLRPRGRPRPLRVHAGARRAAPDDPRTRLGRRQQRVSYEGSRGAHAHRPVSGHAHAQPDDQPPVRAHRGDMRSLRLEGRTFDAVFAHDAISYLTTERDLRSAFETAFVHLRPGGAALEPDHVRETYTDATDHGGHDSEDRRPESFALPAVALGPRSRRHLVPRRLRLPAARSRRRRALDAGPTHAGPLPRATWFELLAEVGFVHARAVGTGYDDEDVGAEGFLASKPA